ncbi:MULTISPECIES: peptidylprolyl isomerase [Halocynthiibacter]|uniref:Parvulin-like PPIase n=1 Tax=Halocynthiibacter halioticoli TaxID=2986804 RepID=A0AAE3J2H4_9RHOB|nr:MULTISPECIES: peptidylprolyl isomerase [Halocynthiibacter]MCV6825561.1 peptidylprolyl isomerase [Halocynthiibacter halioticoli]MCW4058562.1 peptidylprolyl isomerase [Halocynthiibacter sp. SDUM655004]
MLKRTKIGITALLLAGTAPVFAEEAGPSTVVATVNGTEITLGHMIVARETLPQNYQNIDDKQLFDGILENLIQQTLLDQSLNGEYSEHDKLAMENDRRAFLAGAAITAAIRDAITDDVVQELYDEAYKDAELGSEYSAAHILVETEDEAKALVEELEGGADFAELAREKSTGPSSPNGGDLGWFSKGMMVPPFEEAVMALEDGAVSAPVETQFGWHVILRKESREVQPPAIDEVRDQLVEPVQREVLTKLIEDLTNAADISQAEEGTIDPALIKKSELLE